MREFAKAAAADRDAAFAQASIAMGLPPAMAEKDFWVCWTLDYLFSRCAYRESFSWKGGTTLSKAFGLISRFSEDIDLIIDWRLLGYGAGEPWEERSNTKQDAFVGRINADAASFLQDELKPLMERDLAGMLDGDFSLRIDANDPQTLCFDYPRLYEEGSILQEIRLESGALAAWTPTQTATITPYVAERFPRVFSSPSTSVRTVSPERTFWEKATILHKEAMRTNGRLPDRYARHYYDLHMMCSSPVKDAALADLGLLDQVVEFKMRFWRSNAARYDLCRPGTFRLVPPDDQMRRVRDDYDRMRRMIFGEVPDFEDVMRSIANLEAEINALP